MCKCRPEIRTPWCGRIGCEIPGQAKEEKDTSWEEEHKHHLYSNACPICTNRSVCPVCKGAGIIENPKHTDEIGMKKVCAEALKQHGYSVRQIMKFIGYKSPNSVQKIPE